VSWLAACVAAAADLACEEAGAYPAGTPTAHSHWFAAPAGIPMHCEEMCDWPRLQGLAVRGTVVIRVDRPDDPAPCVLAACAIAAANPPAAQPGPQLPAIRRAAWSGAQRIVFLVRVGT
jgi:hypothetical protein